MINKNIVPKQQNQEQLEESIERLQENRHLLELFVRNAPAAIAMLDKEMRYLVVSNRWIEDYQLAEKDIIGRTHYEVFPEIPERWKQDHQDCLTGKVEVLKSEEDSFVRLDGRVDWLRWELRPWHNQAGEISGLLMLSEVITERKLLEQQLKSSEARLRALFEAMTDLVFTIDTANNSIEVLPTRFADLHNLVVQRQIVKKFKQHLFDSEEAENYHSLNQQIAQNHGIFDFELSLPIDSELIWFSITISAVSQTVVIWVAHNITQRKQMEQNLLAEKELSDITLKSIGDAVITADALGKITYLNPMAENLTGWKTHEAKGNSFTKIFQIINAFSRQPVVNPIDLVLEKNRACDLSANTILIAKDGTEHFIEDSAAPICDRQGNTIGAVMVFRDGTHSYTLSHELTWAASHDPLTKLYNRRKFNELVDAAIREVRGSDTHHALCYLDLDRFKIVNDTCGHTAGDELLVQITQLLKQRIRDSDIFARLGGDEFGLLLHRCPLEIAEKIANQLRQIVHEFRFTCADKMFRIGVSIGLVAVDSHTDNLADLLKKADAACYAAKEKGRNNVYLYREQDREIVEQRGATRWFEKLNRALEESRFCLYAQKIVSLKANHSLEQTKDISERQSVNDIHYEILLRLIDDSGEMIAPGVFIPAAERCDLMPEIDRWVVSTFLAGYEVYCQSRQQRQLSPPTNMYTINLSGSSINNRNFGIFLQEQFARYSVPPQTICFEITETVAISNLDNALTLFQQLKKLGCAIALDDFGSGMSSFNYLKNLQVDYLKIDGSFVKNIAQDRIDYATVECFNHISQIMKIKTIAEYVEDEMIYENLLKIGVNYAQGYGIERPKPLVFDSVSSSRD